MLQTRGSNNSFVRIAMVTAAILLFALYANFNIEGWNWSFGDFIFMGILIFGTGSLFELARRRAAGNAAFKWAASLAVAATFFLIWINGAVGIIGDSDINTMYGLVPLSLLVGTTVSRLDPQGLSYTLFAAAAVQFLIPIIALVIGTEDFRPGVIQVFMLNSVWVTAFTASALLFRQARTHSH
jgi:hypothetical protein